MNQSEREDKEFIRYQVREKRDKAKSRLVIFLAHDW